MISTRKSSSFLTIISLAATLYACQSGTQQSEEQQDSLIGKVDTIPGQPAAAVAAPLLEAALSDTAVTNWESSGMTDQAAFVRFYDNFKSWVATDQKDSIVAYIDFPIPKYKSAAKFLEKYNTIFDSQLKQEVAASGVKDLWANYKGVSLNNGIFWFNQLKGRYVIIAVNK